MHSPANNLNAKDLIVLFCKYGLKVDIQSNPVCIPACFVTTANYESKDFDFVVHSYDLSQRIYVHHDVNFWRV